MLTFPFKTDTRFTLIPKIGEEVLTEDDMVGLKIKVTNENKGVSFTPIWNWSEQGIEIEIQRDMIPSTGKYAVTLDWRKQDESYSDGYKDIFNACVHILFTDSCSVVADKTAIIEMGLNYSVINIVEELPEHGNPGEFYAVIEDAG